MVLRGRGELVCSPAMTLRAPSVRIAGTPPAMILGWRPARSPGSSKSGTEGSARARRAPAQIHSEPSPRSTLCAGEKSPARSPVHFLLSSTAGGAGLPSPRSVTNLELLPPCRLPSVADAARTLQRLWDETPGDRDFYFVVTDFEAAFRHVRVAAAPHDQLAHSLKAIVRSLYLHFCRVRPSLHGPLRLVSVSWLPHAPQLRPVPLHRSQNDR